MIASGDPVVHRLYQAEHPAIAHPSQVDSARLSDALSGNEQWGPGSREAVVDTAEIVEEIGECELFVPRRAPRRGRRRG